MPILGLKSLILHQKKCKITVSMESQKTLNSNVACIGEVDKHAKFQQKILIFGGGLALKTSFSVNAT